MKKTVLRDRDKEELVSRILQVREDSERQWGMMNATEMLHHLNASVRMILTAKPRRRHTSLKQRITKFVFVHVLKKMPRNAPTVSDLDVVGSRIDTNSFEEERSELLRLLNQFQRAAEIPAVHPFFGALSREEWGCFTWMHIDHHLRQFDE